MLLNKSLANSSTELDSITRFTSIPKAKKKRIKTKNDRYNRLTNAIQSKKKKEKGRTLANNRKTRIKKIKRRFREGRREIPSFPDCRRTYRKACGKFDPCQPPKATINFSRYRRESEAEWIRDNQTKMIDFHENSLMKEKEEELSEKEREEGKVAFSLRGIPLVF